MRLANTEYVGNDYYRLYDAGTVATPSVHTKTLNSASTSPADSYELFNNNGNTWNGLPYNNDMAFDVHWGLQKMRDYLHDTYSIRGYDDNNYPIDAYVRVGYTNTTGSRDNSYWDPYYQALFFGEGESIFRPLASIDVVGHEFGHGITHFQIGWDNAYERPCLNEGLSDIWGIIFEHHFRPDLQTWQLGEQISLTAPYDRNIQTPKDASARIHMADTYLSSTYNNGDRYVKSGVFSHWFYILANGKTGTNDLGNNYSVTGIGFDKAEQLIAEAVFNNYLDGTTTYPTVSTAIANAAKAIFCGDSNKILQVVNAWYAVGVGAYPYISGPSLICNPNISYNFTINNPFASTYISWSSGNSGLTINSSSGVATVQSNFTGPASISATFNGNCVVNMPPKSVWVGPPPAQTIEISSNPDPNGLVCSGNIYGLRSSPSWPEFNYSWSADGGSVVGGQGTSMAQIYFSSDNYLSVFVTASNACGSGSGGLGLSNDCGSGGGGGCIICGFAASPNPTSSTLSITLTKGKKHQLDEVEITLFNDSQMIEFSKITTEQSIAVPTSNLRKGLHFLHIRTSKEHFQEHIIID